MTTRMRTTRDIVTQINDRGDTHTIQRGTYFYVEECEAAIINCGVALDIPERRDDLWLFIGEDFEIVEFPPNF